MTNLTLERIEQGLQQINVNLAEANDIAMLATFTPMPANLEENSRQALGRLRDKLMERARVRANI